MAADLTSEGALERIKTLIELFVSGTAVNNIPTVVEAVAYLVAYAISKFVVTTPDVSPHIFAEAGTELSTKCQELMFALNPTEATTIVGAASPVGGPLTNFMLQQLLAMLVTWLKSQGVTDILQWLIDQLKLQSR